MDNKSSNIVKQLPDLLGQELLAEIYAIRKGKLSDIAQIVQSMVANLSDTDGSAAFENAIREGISQIERYLATPESELLQDRIITNIFVLKEQLPEQLKVNQDEERFESATDDGAHVKVGKGVKRVIRGMGKNEWPQEIPLQNLVAYHLLDADDWYANWIAAEARLLMNFILELQQTLANSISNAASKSSESELRQLLEVFLNQIEEAKSVLDHKLDEARISLNEQLQEAIAKTGTIERRAGFYSNQRISRKREKVQQQLDNCATDWHRNNTQLLAKTSAMDEFVVLCDDVDKEAAEFKEKLVETYDQLFINPQEELIKRIGAVREQIANSEQQLSVVLEQQEQKLSAYVSKEVAEPMQEAIEQEKLEEIRNLFIEQLLQRANKLPETAQFITDIDREKNPPEIKLREVQWRMLVIRAFKEYVLNSIREDDEDLRKFTGEQVREMQEIRDIIEVNLESASELSEDQAERDNPREVVDEALQRAQSKISTCVNEAKNVREAQLKPLDEGMEQFRTTLFELLHHADAQKLKVLDAKYKISEKTLGWRTKVSVRWARLQDRGAVIARFGWQKTKAYYNKYSTWLGLKQPEAKESKKADIAAYLMETEQRFDELPFIYRRLFDFNAMPDERYYVGLNENFGYIQEALDHWQNGLSATMAVVGEKGSGKSTYLGLVKNEVLADQNILHISLDDTIWTTDDLLAVFAEQLPEADCSSVDALVQFLREKQEHRIIIFEGVQNLYLRQINGYDAVEQFVYLIAETADDIFWLISCSRYAWSFLSKAVNINEYFSYLIETDTLKKQQIQKAIMSRHRASGYELVFASSESDVKSRNYKKLLDDEAKAQEYLKEKYFNKLAELSNGNTSIAMIFWLRSIQKFDDTHCYIAPLEVASLEMLENMNPRTLFILTSLVLHDTLHPEELAVIQTMNAQESRMILKRLKSRGVAVDSGHGYFLNHLMYRQVTDELKERNILHL